MEENQLLSLRAAARELGVAERTIRQAVELGELPAFRLGERTMRVERPTLWNWVRGKQVESAAERGRRRAGQ